MTNRILISILFLGSLITNGQNFTLDDCINHAIQHNLTLSNQNIASDIAEEQYKQAKRNLLPTLDAGATSNLYFGRSIDPTTNDFVDQKLFSTNFYLGAQVSLFNGFIKQNTIKFNNLQYLKSRKQVRQKEIDLTYDIMTHFYDALYYQQLLDVVHEQLELTKLNSQKTQKLIDLGLKAEADLLEIQAQEAAELHRQLTVNNQWDNALLKLKRVMNYPLDKPLSLETDYMLTDVTTLGMEDLYRQAVKHMPQLQLAELDMASSKKEIDLARGRFYPSLSLGANYNSRYADTNKQNINLTDSDNPVWEVIPFKQQFKQNASQSVYLRLTIPIFNQWQTRSQVKTAKLRLQTAENNQKEMALNLYQQIAEDHQQLQALVKEHNHLQTQLLSLEKAYNIADKKLGQGLISVIEFYTAKNQLANTKADLLRVKTQLKIKERTMAIYLNN